MKPTDFARSLTDFLSKYLPGERGLSTNTIESYKTTFILFITFMEDKKKITVNKLAIKNITKENIQKIREIGVDFVSSGALTHSAPILDISMKNLHAV